MDTLNNLRTSTLSIHQSNEDDPRSLEQSGGNVNVHELRARTYTFPSPATDLLSHGIASTRGQAGLWAYVSNTAIVVVKSAVDVARSWPLFTMLDASGLDTYCSVSFCQAEPAKWPVKDSPLVGATQEGLVKIFNIENQAIMKFHDTHSGHRTIAEWSPRNARLIYASDDQGQLSIWDIEDNSCVLLSFGEFQTTCMAVSPHEDDIVALGEKDGTVRIIETVGTGSILINLKHCDEIFGLSWKPSGNWSPVTKLRRHVEPFLAVSYTSFKLPAVKICDREGTDLTTLSVTKSETPSTVSKKLIMRSVPLLWVELPSADGEPDQAPDKNRLSLVSIGPDGEVLTWNQEGLTCETIHNVNSRGGIFGLIQSGDTLWSVSCHPYIVGWNLRTNKVEAIIPTYSGICSISHSRIESTRVAIGGVDSYIRIIKIHHDYPNGKNPEMPLIPTKIPGKITAVAFHPWMDKVAFGTDGGILGIYDFKAECQFAMEFTKRMYGIVYTVDWGPKCYVEDFVPKTSPECDSKGTPYLSLFACGNRNAFMITPGRRDNPLYSVGRIIGITNGRDEFLSYSYITDIKWAPGLMYLAVGYSDGKIELFSYPHLKLRCQIKCHSTPIQYLCWRDLDFTDDGSPTKHKYLASAANDGTAKVHELQELYDPKFRANSVMLEFISSVATLNGHLGIRVIQVVWSPHNDNHILTISYDTTAVLWDLSDNTKLARYMGHAHRLVACGFHPTNPYMILTCSDEMMTNPCFHMWDYRQHPEVEEYQEIIAQKSMIEANADCVQALAAPKPKLMLRPGSEDATVSKSKPANRRARHDSQARLLSRIPDRMTLFPLLTHYKAKNSLETELNFIIYKIPLPQYSMLSLFEKRRIEEQSKVVKKLSKVDLLVDEMEVKAVSGELDHLEPDFHLNLFGTAEDVNKIIEREFEGHIGRGNFYFAVSLLGWTKNPEKFIRKLVDAGYIDETMVLFARKCSRKFQMEMTSLYAQHLTKTGRLNHAAWYCWNVLESFDSAYHVLVANGLFLEGLIFSKANRLPGTDNVEDMYVLKEFAKNLKEQNVEPSVIAEMYKAIGVVAPNVES